MSTSSRAKRIIDAAPQARKDTNSLMTRPCVAVSTVANTQVPTPSSGVGYLRPKKHTKNETNHNQKPDILSGPLVTPPPPPSSSSSEPVLMLEGDKYIIGDDGIARTLYKTNLPSRISIEEAYDICGAQKRFILRTDNNTANGESSSSSTFNFRQDQSNEDKGYVSLGKPITTFDLKEVEDGIFGGAGTGSTTWESSIVMSMVFSANPELLYGDVVELGSGVGFGGILNALGPYSSLSTEMKSMTLSDYSPKVLEQCKKNVANAHRSGVPIKVEKLDWYDFIRKTHHVSRYAGQYDTIIACDCAYMYPDIEALTTTMLSLMRQHPRSRIHVFGPSDRGGLQELVRQLRSKPTLKLEVRSIDMQRYRIMPSGDLLLQQFPEMEMGLDCPFATKYESTHLHVICTPCETRTEAPSMFKLD